MRCDQRYLIIFLPALIALMLSLSSTVYASGPSPPRQEYTQGLPSPFAWVVLAGSEQQNDVDAITAVSDRVGLASQLRFVVSPLSQTPGKPRNRATAVTAATAAQLPGLFADAGAYPTQLRLAGVEKLDFTLLHVTGHARANTSYPQWGKEEITPSILVQIIRTLLAAHRAPVLLFIDQCYAAPLAEFRGQLSEDERMRLFIITGAPAKLPTFAGSLRQFAQWFPRPIPSETERELRALLGLERAYSVPTMGLLAALLGAAPDPDKDGLDSSDLCSYLSQSTSADGVGPIQCRALDRPLRFFAKNIQILLLRQPNKNFTTYDDAHALAATTFKRTAASNGISRWLTLCVDRSQCPTPVWTCSVLHEPVKGRADPGWNFQCINQRGPRQGDVIKGATVYSIEALRASMLTTATVLLAPLWEPPEAVEVPTVQGQTTTAVPLLVLLDQSESMLANDPTREKRREFFNHVIGPALREQRVHHLRVVGFASTVTSDAVCFDRKRQPSYDDALRCWERQLAANGGTDLIGAGERAISILQKERPFRDAGGQSSIWIVSDGQQTDYVLGCPSDVAEDCSALIQKTKCRTVDLQPTPGDEHPPTTQQICEFGGGPADWEKYNACTKRNAELPSKYAPCVEQKRKRIGHGLSRLGRVEAIFLSAQSHNVDALRQLSAVAEETKAGSIEPVGHLTGPKLIGSLTAMGARLASQSLRAVVPAEKTDCKRDEHDVLACIAFFRAVQFDRASPRLDIVANSGVLIERTEIVLQLIDAGRTVHRDTRTFALFALATGNSKVPHPSGVTLKMRDFENGLTLELIPETSSKVTFGTWDIEVRYRVSRRLAGGRKAGNAP